MGFEANRKFLKFIARCRHNIRWNAEILRKWPTTPAGSHAIQKRKPAAAMCVLRVDENEENRFSRW